MVSEEKGVDGSMNRYHISGGSDRDDPYDPNVTKSDNGEWVKYSDIAAFESMLRKIQFTAFLGYCPICYGEVEHKTNCELGNLLDNN